MKVLMINGSPRKGGNTTIALDEMKKIFEANNVEVKEYQVGNMEIRGCLGCGACRTKGKCVIDDIVNEIAVEFESADGLVVGSPVYYAAANSTVVSLLNRLFYSVPFSKAMKVGASVAVARRGGIQSTFDQLNRYFTISSMPVASSTYWNGVHGLAPGEAVYDLEGMQVMRNLANNMIFLMKSINLGKEAYGIPEPEPRTGMNFVRTAEIEMKERLCPCCEKYLLDTVGQFEICPVCGWEDDKVQRKDPDFEGGANELSLNQARKAFNNRKGE